jgi:hypothetical protein
MKPIFVDTSALIAIGNKRDTFHRQALQIREELKQTNRYFVTTNAVLLEFGNTFSSVTLKPIAIKLIEALKQSSKWNCIQIDEVILNKGFGLYKQVQDKEWGLVDCTSIIVAKDFKINEIFTTDHHFEQAGLTILLI